MFPNKEIGFSGFFSRYFGTGGQQDSEKIDNALNPQLVRESVLTLFCFVHVCPALTNVHVHTQHTHTHTHTHTLTHTNTSIHKHTHTHTHTLTDLAQRNPVLQKIITQIN